jgi:hypothetical protein
MSQRVMLVSMTAAQQKSGGMFLTFALVLALTAHLAVAQDEPASPMPAQGSPLSWQQLVRLHDGRTFVSDGRFALDAELAKPAVMPSQVLQEPIAKLIEGYVTAELPDEFGFSQLTRGGKNYTAPSGVLLNSMYVDYLRRALPASRLRFRMKSDSEPIVILLDGKAVGLLMPMKSVKP